MNKRSQQESMDRNTFNLPMQDVETSISWMKMTCIQFVKLYRQRVTTLKMIEQNRVNLCCVTIGLFHGLMG